MEQNNDTVISTDEQNAEQEALQEAKEEEIRTKVIEEFGFDEVDDAERIDKLVQKEMSFHQTKASLTRQKIKHREAAEALKNDPRLKETTPPASQSEQKKPEVDVEKAAKKAAAEALEQRDLDELDYPDALKKEIQQWATFKGISIKAAAKAPHIAGMIADHEKQAEADEAAITRKNRSGGSKSFSLDTPPNVDMSTEEGRKTWHEWKAWAAKQQ